MTNELPKEIQSEIEFLQEQDRMGPGQDAQFALVAAFAVVIVLLILLSLLSAIATLSIEGVIVAVILIAVYLSVGELVGASRKQKDLEIKHRVLDGNDALEYWTRDDEISLWLHKHTPALIGLAWLIPILLGIVVIL